MERHLAIIYIRSRYIFWQSGCESKMGQLSSLFLVLNFVKLDGVLSPILFTIYIDNLFSELKRTGIGCYGGNIFARAFEFTDDIILLSPTVCSRIIYTNCAVFW